MSILSEDDKADVAELLEEMDRSVGIHLFVDGCETCDQTVDLNEDIADLADEIALSVHDLDAAEAETYDADKYGTGPVAVFTVDGTDTGVRYFGIPSGQEFNSYLTDIVAASTGDTQLEDGIREQVQGIDEPVEIKVFVTPTCPHCPQAVITAHSFALENENVTAEMIEAQEFMEVSQEYGVRGVPQINVNGHDGQFTGARPPAQFLDEVEAAL